MAYNADSIQVRDFRTAARLTPGMYIGADGQDAMFNCFLEILNNACDEAIMGRGNEITVEVNDNDIKISDKGAGVPRGRNKDTVPADGQRSDFESNGIDVTQNHFFLLFYPNRTGFRREDRARGSTSLRPRSTNRFQSGIFEIARTSVYGSISR